MSVLLKVIEIAGEHAARGIEIKPESELIAGLGFDSLDVLEFTMSLEHVFKIEIDDAEVEQWITIQDAIISVEKTLAQKQAA